MGVHPTYLWEKRSLDAALLENAAWYSQEFLSKLRQLQRWRDCGGLVRETEKISDRNPACRIWMQVAYSEPQNSSWKLEDGSQSRKLCRSSL